ncbi:hypothetical protein ANCCAN_06416 [Ancylostoma caninum]|uniref:Uncharacterized protein n=1 Tax=Ancylostoma caninum TaxID=29170 RepID=A0A368GW00_ANCCA|nr:hypothetical protein ANCCAN_06416 [Ancylostoma caninum]
MSAALLLLWFGIASTAAASDISLDQKWLETCGRFPYYYENACHQLVRWDYEARWLWDSIPKEKPNETVYDCMDLKCLCRYMNGKCISRNWDGSECSKNGTVLKKAVRKEYRMLTDEERRRYHDAMNNIKVNGEYDKLARIHKHYTTSPAAHGGSGFLPWNREYMKR